MAILREKKKQSSAVNIDADNQRTSDATGTAARKFSAPVSPTVSKVMDAVKNDLHMDAVMNSTVDLKSKAAEIVQIALTQLQVVRKEISDAALQLKDFSEVSKTKDDVTLRKFSDIIDSVNISTFAKKTEEIAAPAVNLFSPILSSVLIDIDKKKGSSDCFYADIKFTMDAKAAKDGKIKAFRIFRCEVIRDRMRDVPALSVKGMELISPIRMSTRFKNSDTVSRTERVLKENSVMNAVTALSPIDPTINKRVSSDTDSLAASLGTVALSLSVKGMRKSSNSFIDGSDIDASVSENVNAVMNLRRNVPSFIEVPNDIVVAGKENNTTTLDIIKNNAQEFKQISFISPDKLRSTEFGNVIEYVVNDETVAYGKTYRYYVTSIDDNMIESVRSRLVDVDVHVIRVPASPENVYTLTDGKSVALNISVADDLVEKFEVYRRDATTLKRAGEEIEVSTIASLDGFNTKKSLSTISKNGFVRIGESSNGGVKVGSIYTDRDIVPGRTYEYRIYSVDIFGNKSERPGEVNVFIPDKGGKHNDLTRPSISAEIDSLTNKMKLSFSCADDRISMLMLSRRDLTINQKAFTTPTQLNRIKLGAPRDLTGRTSSEDIVMRGENKDFAWTGMHTNTGLQMTFVDSTVTLDHTYQYKIYGIDRLGNRTIDAISKPIMITRRPMIGTPLGLRASVIQGLNFVVGGILLQWNQGADDISTSDKIGNRLTLTDTSVRTLYLLERRRIGEDIWKKFPMVENITFFDSSAVEAKAEHPPLRPEFIEENLTYIYRVRAFQTGSFISDYSEMTEVFASLPIYDPSNFRIKMSDAGASPLYVALNWDTLNGSAVVDKWEIERSAMNNIAAANVNFRSPTDIDKLAFSKFRTVFRESSRFSSYDTDNIAATEVRTSMNKFSGNHYFQDVNVALGNSYFYRIRAVGIDGAKSGWVYRGARLTDTAYEVKTTSQLTKKNIAEMMEKKTPVYEKSDEIVKDSFSMLPDFSRPAPLMKVTVGEAPPELPTAQGTLRVKTLKRAELKTPIRASKSRKA